MASGATIKVSKSGLSTTFTLIPSSGYVHSVEWFFGDGTAKGIGSPITHTYGAKGNYSVTAFYTDGYGDDYGSTY